MRKFWALMCVVGFAGFWIFGLMAVAGTAGYFAKLGLPMADILVWLVILIEAGGALLLIVGWQTRLVCLDVAAGGILHHLQRIRLQLRRRRQPAHALGAHVVVDQAARVLLRVGQR